MTKQYKRSRKIFNDDIKVPVFLTQASQFNDGGLNQLFFSVMQKLIEKQALPVIDPVYKNNVLSADEHIIIPAERQNYLAEIMNTTRKYKARVQELAQKASKWGALNTLQNEGVLDPAKASEKKADYIKLFEAGEVQALETWNDLIKTYAADEFIFKVRDREIRQSLVSKSLSGTKIRKVIFQ